MKQEKCLPKATVKQSGPKIGVSNSSTNAQFKSKVYLSPGNLPPRFKFFFNNNYFTKRAAENILL